VRKTGYRLLKYLSPLDIGTILYILFSGIYMLIGSSHLTNMLPHFALRIIILVLIALLIYAKIKFPNKIILLVKNTYPLLFLSFFYTETSYLKNILFSTNLDLYFSHAEQYFWGCQPSMAFAGFMPQNWFNEWMNICYFSYYFLTLVICITLYILEREKSYKGIFIVVFSFYMYYTIYDFLPVVGPQFYFDTMRSSGTPPYFFGKIMRYILLNMEEPTGAFPSSHVGIALILSYVAYKDLKKVFYISFPFILGICFATVYLKAHYLLDVLGALISVPLFIAISSFLYNKISEKLKLINSNYLAETPVPRLNHVSLPKKSKEEQKLF
jgi:membrane-associated phospholipid phosphatase